MTLSGTDVVANSAANGAAGGGGLLQSSGALTVRNGSITTNEAARAGGGIESIAGTVTLEDVDLGGPGVGNEAGIAGGGLYVGATSTATLSGGVVEANQAGQEGGGLFNDGGSLEILAITVRGNLAGSGAGLFHGALSSGSTRIERSTFFVNQATGAGGAIAAEGGLVTVTNSTISTNSATAGGGGIEVSGGTVRLVTTTVTENLAPQGAGLLVRGGTATARSTILAQNDAPASPDVLGTLESEDFNFIGDATGAAIAGTTTHNLGGNALLGPLQSNGGTTQTHLPLAGSPVIDQGIAGGLPIDQRFFSRTIDDGGTANAADGTDIGAVETGSSAAQAVLTATKSVSGDFEPGGTITYEIVITNIGPGDQDDNPDHELLDVLSDELTLLGAVATSGDALADLGFDRVTWNGSLDDSESVTITITATIGEDVEPGTVITNQGTLRYDADGNGSNESSGVTDDATEPGFDDTTSFVVGGGGGAVASEIPTLGEAVLALFATALAAVAVTRLRR